MRWSVRIFSVLFLAGVGLAKEIVDFAPLTVGNSWVFQGYTRSNIAPDWKTWKNSRDERMRILRVLSRHTAGDTSVYRLEVLDSLYLRIVDDKPARDTVHRQEYQIRERKGVLLPVVDLAYPVLIQEAFRTHQYEDSLVQMRTLSGQARLVAAESVYVPGLRTVTLKVSEKIKDVGTYRFVQQYNTTGSALPMRTYEAYSLMRFNDSGFTPVGIRADEQPAAQAGKVANRRAFLGKLGMDFLGRRVPRSPSP